MRFDPPDDVTANRAPEWNDDPYPDDDHHADEKPDQKAQEPQNEFDLPADYDPDLIPNLTDLQRVAIKALHRETAFVIMNQANPEVIADRLDELAELVQAAIGVDGPHLKKAIRLGLALKREYWVSRDKLDDWNKLIGPLLTTAIRIKEFQCEVYRIWSLYRYLNWQFTGTLSAIDASLAYAEESGREDLQLLARSDRFNFNIYALTLDEVEAQAAQLRRDARRLGYKFVWGRTYYSMARAYDRNSMPKKAFEYAQQALAILAPSEMILAAESIITMLGMLNRNTGHAPQHQAKLRHYLHTVGKHSLSPGVEAGMHYVQGLEYYHAANYEDALNEFLLALQKYQQGRSQYSIYRVRHMLGLVETKRRQWEVAEHYFRTAYEGYQKVGDQAYAVHALHANAFVPVEQQNWALALDKMQAARREAEQIEETETRNELLHMLDEDIADIRSHL